MNEFDKFKSAIFGQESNNGAVDTSKPNYAGARGKGQILESTFKGLQKNGAIPADYDWSNPAHNEAAAEAAMQEAWTAAGADPRRAAAYYYGGPKAIKGGSIVSYKDLKNPKAPTTIQYADQIAQRMGILPADAGPRPAPSLSPLEAAIRGTVLRVPAATTAQQLADYNEQALAKENERPDLIEQFGAALEEGTDARIFGPLKEAIWGPKYTPVEGFTPDPALLSNINADSDLVEDYFTSRSPEEATKVLKDFSDEAERAKTIGNRGPLRAFLIQAGVEVASPTNWAAAFAAPHLLAARGLGSVAMLARGASRTEIIGAGIAENIASGTALEATAQLMQGRFSGSDLLVSLAADGLLGAASGAITSRASSMARAETLIRQIGETASAQELAAVARAQAKLGPEATTEQIVEAVRAERKAEANEPLRQSTVADNGLMGRTLTRGIADDVDNRVLGEIDGAGAYPTVAQVEAVGRLNRAAPDTPEFREFFGNSQVVTPEGQPVVVYHLTKAENLEEFDKSKLGTNTGATSAKEGFFFAGDPNTVNVYAKTAADTGSNPNVIPVYLSLQNPLVFDMGGSVYRKRSYASIIRQAKEEGRDGVIIRNTFDGGSKDDVYVAFEPTQIKSAIGNTGAYSKTNPKINQDMEADFETTEQLVLRQEDFKPGGRYEAEISSRTNGEYTSLAELEKLTAGVHVTQSLVLQHRAAVDTVQRLAKKFLKDTAVVIHSSDVPMANGGKANADIMQVTDRVAIIRLSPDLSSGEAMRSAVHEIGHAIFNRHIASMAPEAKAKLFKAFNEFVLAANKSGTSGNEARAMRYSLTNSSMMADQATTAPLTSRYEIDWDEFSAEQFVKFLEEDAVTVNKFGLHANVIRMIKDAVHSALAWLKFAKRQNLGVTNEYREFFETILNTPEMTEARSKLRLSKVAQADQPAAVATSIMTSPDANRFGLSTIPVGTKAERDDAKAILALHQTAEQKAPVLTPEYQKRVKNLADNSVFNVASTGLLMLKSESPLVRWVASELLEDASGVQVKRGTTASIKKHIVYRQMMANTVNDIEGAYRKWSKGMPGGLQDDIIGGKNRAAFDRAMAAEIEARRLTKQPVTQDANVKAAVDSLEAAYTRTAKAQVNAKTLGSEGLPTDSIGYMPHRMSPKAVMSLTNEQRQIVHSALTDQFITIEGWDASFSDMLASKYLQRVTDRATGGNASSMGGNSSSTVDLIEEALNGMEIPADQVAKHMEKFKKGAANFTKGRIELDLNKAYPTANGEFKLLDIFETDQLTLLRGQVERASGDVALALKGVQGKPGLTLLRKAMQFGEDGKKATPRELEAFDQIAAEFLGEPFGTATPKWMERAMSANTLVRLGGIFYNQLSESINAIAHVGVARAFESVAGLPRLRNEILALARGEQVNNSIIGSIELAGGAEFGTDAYKIVMPYDNPSNAMPTYGQDTLTLTDRLLRGAGHLQTKLSGWRWLHAAQQRGMAEQIVHKTLRYIREGKDDVALQQFGITPELRAAMRAELGTIARFDGDRLVEFDVTKMSDPAMREQLIQAVWRGTSQIIQGTYIGERGKWAHDGTMKLMTQFRTFSITSMEKQWGRQRNSRGAVSAGMIVMGAMTLAAPIYMARTYAASIGRPDQEAYLEERLEFQMIARATMNYVAGLGMAPDFVDLLSATLPDSLGVKPTGGRAGVESEFVGNYIAPSLSLVNDVWGYAQSPLEIDEAAKIMPFSRLPFMLPLMNATKE